MKHADTMTMADLFRSLEQKGYVRKTIDGSMDPDSISFRTEDEETISCVLVADDADYGKFMPELAAKYGGWICLSYRMPDHYEATVDAIRKEMSDLTDSGDTEHTGIFELLPGVFDCCGGIPSCPTPESFVESVAKGRFDIMLRDDFDYCPCPEELVLDRIVYDGGSEIGILVEFPIDGPKTAVSITAVEKVAQMIRGMENPEDVRSLTGDLLTGLLLQTYDPSEDYSEVFSSKGVSLAEADPSLLKDGEGALITPENLTRTLGGIS